MLLRSGEANTKTLNRDSRGVGRRTGCSTVTSCTSTTGFEGLSTTWLRLLADERAGNQRASVTGELPADGRSAGESASGTFRPGVAVPGTFRLEGVGTFACSGTLPVSELRLVASLSEPTAGVLASVVMPGLSAFCWRPSRLALLARYGEANRDGFPDAPTGSPVWVAGGRPDRVRGDVSGCVVGCRTGAMGLGLSVRVV